MVELYSSFFDALRLAKAFADHDQFKETRRRFDHCTLDEDLAYEISLEVVGMIFQGTNMYYNEEGDFGLGSSRTRSSTNSAGCAAVMKKGRASARKKTHI